MAPQNNVPVPPTTTYPIVASPPASDTAVTTLSNGTIPIGTVYGKIYTTTTTNGQILTTTVIFGESLKASTSSIVSPSQAKTTSSSATSSTSQTSHSTSTDSLAGPSKTGEGSHGSNGLQNHAGEVAGIAIGVGLALALVAFLITFFVMRRKQNALSQRRHHGEKPNNSYLSGGSVRDPPGDHGPKHPIVTDLSVAAGPSRGLETHLPPSADDSTVRNRVSTLYEQISLHVENFYHKSAIPIPLGAEADLEDFESPYLPGTLAVQFQQAKSGVPIIKHCLTRLTLSRISPSGDPTNTFLPNEFVSLPHALEKTRSSKQKAPGFDEALSRWRVLSAYLMPHPSALSSYVSSRDAAIAEAVQSVSRAFRPWVNNRYTDSDRVHNLTEIMKSAAEQGVLLFSQPSAYRFHWGNPEELGSGAIPTSPALWKIGDEKGQALRKGEVIIERGVGRI